ncbi:MAG TPA: prolipoprotein diacylglyceryl transferase [Leptospiraceae bacterium]|jgi:prolipoprotein diacylglyceryltransferase|nr:prolipoprotein diacylglyceryl transferase [Leptospirales bacterium]HMU81908.1 prolipoprotein diacylglyceryl transferase [Leptospiraceae bacterium]HMW58089.1 prolipoprotein diacylglyceryl transferase [Leptospiraceae bacterium]HMX55811.1 prolipoprotein diacylglyceryl transferase [Leptospiraceae bacterium]HMZ36336.1 prolipoprotein diacylglyceryl transferase [Leptospiraceae bacterium]
MLPINVDFLGLHFRGYEGHWAFATLVLGFFYQRAKSLRAGYSNDWFVSAYTFAILTGFVCARLFHFMFWDTTNFLANPLIVFRPGGGFAILGGTIGTGFGGWLYCKRTGANFYHWCESLMTPICLCLALGRISCFLNGDAYGLPSTLPWAVSFSEKSLDWMAEWNGLHHLYANSDQPLAVISSIFQQYVPLSALPLPQSLQHLQAEGVHSVADLARFYPPNALLSQSELAAKGLVPFPTVYPRVHPAQLYELGIMLVAYFFIMYAEKQEWARQRSFFLFWICYGLNRFFIEMVRGDRNVAFASLTYAQVISILLVISGAGAFYYLTRKWKQTGLPEPVLK